MQAPEVRYAKSGDVNIAYSVVGEGPFDLVFVVGWVISTLEYAWEGPPGMPDLETRMDDVRAVMDAAGSRRAAIMGVSEGGPMTALFAATHPERTAAAILYGTGATYLRADDYPWALTREQYLRYVANEERGWSPEYIDKLGALFTPSITGDETLRRFWTRLIRISASPEAAGRLARMNMEIDVRHVLPTIRVPTLVLHVEREKVFDVRGARYMAERIPGADLVLLPGEDHAWFVHPDPIGREVERFLTRIWQRGEWDVYETERVLATILFTDIVDSTAKAVALGDRAWRQLLERHHAIVRRQLVRFRGRELDTAGDGFFASFDGPARAIQCARAIVGAVNDLGLQVRVGLHTGECEVLEGKVGGIAVHIGARVAAEAGPGEVLVSSTVKDLVAGSGIEFRERGRTNLKGVPGEWQLYAVEG